MSQEYKFLANALNSLAGAVWIVDAAMTTTYFANTRFRQLASLPKTKKFRDIDVLDCVKRLGSIFDSADWQAEAPDLTLEKLKETPRFEMVLPTHDGRHMRLNRYEDCEGYVVINFTDVTDFVLASKAAKDAENAKTAFLANMSHEIRTPMNGVIGMTQVLAGTKLDDKQKNYVDLIARSGESLVSIINDILDFSKLESGKFTVHEEPFNFSETINDVVSLLGHTARGKDLELIYDMQSILPRKFVGDSGRLRQILINLIGNAVKFTKDGHVKLGINIHQEDDIASVKFSVSDTGVGISEENIASIFQQFGQADSSTAQNFGGTGLGLTISQQLVGLMGGEISVTSTLGTGSEFSFELEFPISEERSQVRLDFTKLSKTPVLVIDDVPVNHLVISNQLTAIGASPLCVSSVDMALQVMRQAASEGFHFPLVISDFQMPDKNGLDFVKALRSEPGIADTPVMILSSVDMSDHVKELAHLRVTHIYEKPCLSQALNQAVFDILAERNLAQLKTMPEQIMLKKMPGGAGGPSKIKILASDDDEICRQVITELLAETDFELTVVENGAQALEKFSQDIFDVILMDIALPELDGNETIMAIRKLEADNRRVPTPIIAISSHAITATRKELSKAGMNGCLAKPLDKNELLGAVDKWTKAKKNASDIITARLKKAS